MFPIAPYAIRPVDDTALDGVGVIIVVIANGGP